MITRTAKKLIPKSIKRSIDSYFTNRYGFLNVSMPYTIKLLNKGRFTDKVALITGGSGAIGRAISYRLAAEGAIVYVGGMTENKINAVVKEINKDGGIAFPRQIDVTDINSILDTFKLIIEKHSRIDILVTSAGGSAREKSKNIVEQDVQIIDNVLDVNLRGAILCAKEAAAQMIKQKDGKIITLSSTIGNQGKAGFTDYSAAKAGIIGFVKSLAMELGIHGINVNCVSPGIIQRDQIHLNELDRLKRTNYLNAYGTPEDISNMVAFLVSDESSFITGQNFIIDGGRSLGLKGD